VRVVATLRRFLREGTPWRSPTADPGLASGATLRRRLRTWAREGRLQKAHAVLVRLLRGGPDLIVDSCSVRATRGGDLTGPNPTDRAKRGTKYHVAVDAGGVPVACAVTAASASDGRFRVHVAGLNRRGHAGEDAPREIDVRGGRALPSRAINPDFPGGRHFAGANRRDFPGLSAT